MKTETYTYFRAIAHRLAENGVIGRMEIRDERDGTTFMVWMGNAPGDVTEDAYVTITIKRPRATEPEDPRLIQLADDGCPHVD